MYTYPLSLTNHGPCHTGKPGKELLCKGVEGLVGRYLLDLASHHASLESDTAGGEGGHGTAKPEGVIHGYIFPLAKRDRLTSPFASRDRSIRETVMDSFLAIPCNVKHAGGDFSAAGQALAAAGNVCLM